MRDYLRFFKDGDQMGLRTNIQDEREFLEALSESVGSMITTKDFENDWAFQLRYWLPQAFEIVAKLRGYKSGVEVDQVLTSGSASWNDADALYDSGKTEEVLRLLRADAAAESGSE